MENERDALVEYPGRFSFITLQGGVPAWIGGHGSIERDEAVPKHRSESKSDHRERMISMSRVGHPGRFSIISLLERAPERKGARGWIEYDEAVLDHSEELPGISI